MGRPKPTREQVAAAVRGTTLQAAGAALGLTRERVRQLGYGSALIAYRAARRARQKNGSLADG